MRRNQPEIPDYPGNGPRVRGVIIACPTEEDSNGHRADPR